jgi:hypothetical protein
MNFIENSELFYGNATVKIEQPMHLLQACAFYREFYGRGKSLKGFIPSFEYDLLDLDGMHKNLGNVEWFPILADVHQSKADSNFEFKVQRYSVIEQDDGHLHYCITCRADNISVNDRLQFLDGICDLPNLRFQDSVNPVQARIWLSEKDGDFVHLHILPEKQLNREIVVNVDGFCILPSFKAGGICDENNENAFLLAFPCSQQDLKHLK